MQCYDVEFEFVNNFGCMILGTPNLVGRSRNVNARCWSIFPVDFLGILLGRNGADRILHHHNWYRCWIRVFSHHFKRPNLSRFYGEAFFLEADKVNEEKWF